jgi:S1-C subfamily serine protease
VTPAPDEPPTGGPDEEDADTHGWIDPDDRLWRHPSEVAGASASSPAAAAAVGPPGPRDHRRTRIMMLVGAVAAASAAVSVGILLAQGAPPSAPTATTDAASDAPLTTLAGSTTLIPRVANAAGDSMVELRAVTSHGTVSQVGVAVAEGGQVATTAADLSGLRHIDMVGPGGRLLPASVVAVDHNSDIALVEVPDDLPVPPFSDDVSLHSGGADMILTTATATAGGGTVTLRCTPGSVTGVGGAIAGGPASGMPGITATAPGVPVGAGDLLLNTSGAVLGIYDSGSTPSAGAPTFLPTQLVLGVADDLRSRGRVNQGWLGITGSDSVGQSGVDVAQVTPGSPAAGRLQAGDVIAGLDSVPVRTMADLRGRLYVLPPSTPVTLSVRTGSTSTDVGVTLSASP